jgi:hypothetical protein
MIPMGMAITEATAMIRTLPSSALAMPPPDSPTGFGMLTRKCQLILVMPALRMYPRMNSKGMTQANART